MQRRKELYQKLNSLVNKFGGDEMFMRHIDQIPRTILSLIYSDPQLMLRFKLAKKEENKNDS